MHRDRFPGLDGPWARLDGPGGSQPLDAAIDAMAAWMRSGDAANQGGAFAAALATEALVADTRATVGRLLGAPGREVVLGPSMTTLTLAFAQAVGTTLRPGDEVVCTRIDHDANVAPWLLAARDAGASVVWAEPEPGTLALGPAQVQAVLTEHTRWVAVTAASNVVGTVPDVPGICALAHDAGARVFVDAVHLAPHRPVDVGALGCDALACSPYKWFGPHAGVLWAHEELLGGLPPRKLRPSSDGVPERWETGTPAFEALAGTRAAASFLLDELDWDAVRAHEDALLARTLDGLGALPGVTLHGAAPDRTPTVLFSVAGHAPVDVARHLAARQVAVGHGGFYAQELVGLLGLPDGAVRAGFLHYNEPEDAGRLVEGVAALVARTA